jgi:hypothetical protein
LINNYSDIRPFLKFDDPDFFYFLQILQRRKDNPDLPKDMIIIDNFFIYSEQQFDSMMPRIIQMCDLNNARAYLRLNRRSARQVALKTLTRTSEMIEQGNYEHVNRAYLSCCGEFHAEKDKTWIIDLDDGEDPSEIIKLINGIDPPMEKAIMLLNTKNGQHLISRPFRKDEFRSVFPNIDVHTDNPTILYCP